MFFWSNNSFSNEKKEEKLSKEETLQRLIETELISEKYEKCIVDKDPAPWDCVWKQLSPDEKEQVSEVLGEFSNKETDSSGNRYEAKAIGGLFSEKASPVMKELGDNLFDMFQEAMYGEITNEVLDSEMRLIDHAVFYDIYKARISKEFIEMIASFCLDSRAAGAVYTIPSDPDALKKLREKNIQNMHNDPKAEKKKFNLCITEIRNICTHQANGGTCSKVNKKKHSLCL